MQEKCKYVKDVVSPSCIRKNALWQDVRGLAEDAIRKGAEIGIETQSGMLGDALHGVGITTRQSFASMFARTQDEAVASVLNGSIYAGKRAGLSRRIWNNEALLGGQIEQLIASAVAQGRSATQLARDLEAYVKPDAMMPDNWNGIYEGLPFAFHVDYNAKRLAVSALNHSYFQGAILAGRENPYAEFLHWELSRSHEIYDVCDTYMEHDEGLGKGNFALDNAPLPHPFCKCTWYLDSSKSLEEIGQELGEWLAGAENPKLERAFGAWKTNMLDIGRKTFIIGNEGVRSLPIKSEAPKAVYDLAYPNGQIMQRRYYDSDRNVEMDIDTSDHKQPLGHTMGAHKHVWNMNENPPRSKPMRVSMDDIQGNSDILSYEEGGNVHDISEDGS